MMISKSPAIILRMYEAYGSHANVSVHTKIPVKSYQRYNNIHRLLLLILLRVYIILYKREGNRVSYYTIGTCKACNVPVT